MAKKQTVLVRGCYFGVSLIEAFMVHAEELGVTEEVIHSLVEPRGRGKELAKLAGRKMAEVVAGAIQPKGETSFFRKTEELAIQIPALPRPTLKELQARFSWTKKIESDSSPTEAVVLELGTVLRTDEQRIGGKDYEHRLGLGSDPCLGFQQALWLVKHQDEFPEFKAPCGNVYIDFPGLVVLGSGGDRGFPCLIGNGFRWYLSWRWFGSAFNRNVRVARPCQ